MTRLLLKILYDFLIRHFKRKRTKSCFRNLEKRKIRIFEHWPLYREAVRGQTDGQTDTGHSRYRAMYSRCTYVAR